MGERSVAQNNAAELSSKMVKNETELDELKEKNRELIISLKETEKEKALVKEALKRIQDEVCEERRMHSANIQQSSFAAAEKVGNKERERERIRRIIINCWSGMQKAS